MTYGAERANTFEFGRVIDRTFATIRDNFLNYFLLALVLTGLPALITQAMTIAMPPTGADAATGFLVRGLVQIVAGLLGLVLQGALVWGTVTYLNGRKASMREVVGVGLRTFLPLLGLGILLGLAVGLGLILLIVPGIMLLVIWAVAVPALVVEKTGVFGAFSRSGVLTKGNRWAVFGLGLLFLVLIWILTAIAGVVVGVLFYGGFTPVAALGAHGPLAYVGALVMGVATAAVGVIGAVPPGVLYVELRQAREGVAPQSVAQVFE